MEERRQELARHHPPLARVRLPRQLRERVHEDLAPDLFPFGPALTLYGQVFRPTLAALHAPHHSGFRALLQEGGRHFADALRQGQPAGGLLAAGLNMAWGCWDGSRQDKAAAEAAYQQLHGAFVTMLGAYDRAVEAMVTTARQAIDRYEAALRRHTPQPPAALPALAAIPTQEGGADPADAVIIDHSNPVQRR